MINQSAEFEKPSKIEVEKLNDQLKKEANPDLHNEDYIKCDI